MNPTMIAIPSSPATWLPKGIGGVPNQVELAFVTANTRPKIIFEDPTHLSKTGARGGLFPRRMGKKSTPMKFAIGCDLAR